MPCHILHGGLLMCVCLIDFSVAAADLTQIKGEEWLKHQPFGQMPWLEDTENGVELFEARAIAKCELSCPQAEKTDCSRRRRQNQLAPPPAAIRPHRLGQIRDRI